MQDWKDGIYWVLIWLDAEICRFAICFVGSCEINTNICLTPTHRELSDKGPAFWIDAEGHAGHDVPGCVGLRFGDSLPLRLIKVCCE